MRTIFVLAFALFFATSSAKAADPCSSGFFDEMAKCQTGEAMDYLPETRYAANAYVDETPEDVEDHEDLDEPTLMTRDEAYAAARVDTAFDLVMGLPVQEVLVARLPRFRPALASDKVDPIAWAKARTLSDPDEIALQRERDTEVFKKRWGDSVTPYVHPTIISTDEIPK